jgi:asparagine N-glycosylation enzyme membrane subunit Stt3
MINIGKGIIAGLVASAAVAGIVFLGSMAGLALAADPVRAVSGIMLSPTELSWVLHFVVGTFLWGSLFAVLSPVLPSPFWLKGVVFGFLAWLLMLLVSWGADPVSPPQPSLGPVLLHMLFGAVLGWLYGVLLDRAEREASPLRATLTRR